MTDQSVLSSLVQQSLGGNQFIRKVSLIVYGTPQTPTGTGIAVPAQQAPTPGVHVVVSKPALPATQSALDLSNLRIQFQVEAMDLEAPPTATIRVINLAASTVKRIQKEFQSVVLQAGYANGNFGVIFKGTIIRIRTGRLNNIDSFVDIMASNLDVLYNFGFVNTTVKNATPQGIANAIASSVNSTSVAQGTAGADAQTLKYGTIPSSFSSGGVLPRGKVMFGLARKYLKQLADTQGCVWSIAQDGTINIKPLTGYLPNQVVKINAQTGLVDVPEASTQGIEVHCLLNPKIVPGTRIQLNNADLTQTLNNQGPLGFPAYGDFQFFANTSYDGIYTALVVEHEGDTRGEGRDWVTKITALSLDQSSHSLGGTAAGVAAYG